MTCSCVERQQRTGPLLLLATIAIAGKEGDRSVPNNYHSNNNNSHTMGAGILRLSLQARLHKEAAFRVPC